MVFADQVREFPEDMARRIRRHFRHFYSKKSAIDETKILRELSSSLRKEVSGYLITQLMGDESIFMTMGPNLWPRLVLSCFEQKLPMLHHGTALTSLLWSSSLLLWVWVWVGIVRRLLPLLRPMGFEQKDVVCEQNEDASEMYVVVSGTLLGETRMNAAERVGAETDTISFPSRNRHIGVGGSVNTLYALGIWPHCLETVTAQQTSETYALSEVDMSSLFQGSDTDKALFEEIKMIEMARFAFDKHYDTAPTLFGRPLYFSCFSTVQLSLVTVRGAFRGTNPKTAARRAHAEPTAVQQKAAAAAAEAGAAAKVGGIKNFQSIVSSDSMEGGRNMLRKSSRDTFAFLTGRECWSVNPPF